jgi:hypothetical protein
MVPRAQSKGDGRTKEICDNIKRVEFTFLKTQFVSWWELGDGSREKLL